MLSKTYFSLVEYFCENMGYLYSHLLFSLFFFLLWTSFVPFYFCITHVSFYNKILREILSRTQSIYFDKPNKHIFLPSPSVGVEHFGMDKKHVFAYSQCRSSTYLWRIRDLDFGSMINLSRRVNKT
jgi:hypothetical protein